MPPKEELARFGVLSLTTANDSKNIEALGSCEGNI
jgi:hypothetical protein